VTDGGKNQNCEQIGFLITMIGLQRPKILSHGFVVKDGEKDFSHVGWEELVGGEEMEVMIFPERVGIDQ